MTAPAKKADPPMQHCDNCGAELGRFHHSRRFDGPTSCGEPACERAANEQEREAQDERRQAAEDDGYGRY